MLTILLWVRGPLFIFSLLLRLEAASQLACYHYRRVASTRGPQRKRWEINLGMSWCSEDPWWDATYIIIGWNLLAGVKEWEAEAFSINSSPCSLVNFGKASICYGSYGLTEGMELMWEETGVGFCLQDLVIQRSPRSERHISSCRWDRISGWDGIWD